VEDLDALTSIGESISRDLRTEYVLGYSPTNPARDGKYRQIKLELTAPEQPKLRADYRRGYYAPSQ
jgi:Ca-activated chloride channel family protein